MEFRIIFQTSRKVTIEFLDFGIYYTEKEYELFLDGEKVLKSNHVVQSISGLTPDTEYELTARAEGEEDHSVRFRTEYEFVTLNVRKFGAKGDGIHDDTVCIQAAICACPPKGRVYLPKGVYKVSSLFLKSHMTLDIGEGAVLSAYTEREKFPILPGLIESYDETSEYNLGTWEGNPLDMFGSILTGIHVSDVCITGEGIIDGNASYENWWEGEGREKKGGAYRPRMIYLNHCERVTVHGLTIQNSPAWNLHPYFSDHTRWIDLKVLNPKDSPNTDGMDPESVDGLEVVGVYFSLGDDCIAVKSGKFYMGHTYKVPSRNIEIRQCYMRHGHGAVTLGSEMAAGVKHLLCHDCIFEDTDRGLRVKTRRGRGKDAVIEDIVFDHIQMDGVMTPFVVNSFYWCCDPDGRSSYVSTKEALPVDDRTPQIKDLAFRHITAKNCHVAGAFLYGLPEAKIESVEMEDIHIDFAKEPTPGYPAMMAEVEPCTNRGIFIRNVKQLALKQVEIQGVHGEIFELGEIDCLKKE